MARKVKLEDLQIMTLDRCIVTLDDKKEHRKMMWFIWMLKWGWCVKPLGIKLEQLKLKGYNERGRL